MTHSFNPVPKYVPWPIHKSHQGCSWGLSNKITLSHYNSVWFWLEAVQVPLADSYWTPPPLLILAYMTESKTRPHTPEVVAKNSEFQKDHLLIKLNCTQWQHWRNWENEKKGSKGKKNCKKKTCQTKRKTSQWSPSVILADKRTNCISASRHLRVKLHIGSYSVVFVCEHVDICSLRESQRWLLPFILASFVFRYSVVSLFYWAEKTVIIPNSIIFINATGLGTVHSQGARSGRTCLQSA